MACSCKKVKKVGEIYNTQLGAYSVVNLESRVRNKIKPPRLSELAEKHLSTQDQAQPPAKSSAIIPIQVYAKAQYDFGTDIKPDQLCLLCAMKHTAYAITLWQSSKNTLNKYFALGQLSAAADHYRPYNNTLYQLWHNSALYLMRNTQDTQVLHSLLQLSLVPDSQPSTEFVELVSSNIESSTIQESFICVLKAYALLYAQFGYLEINRAYAVGLLQQAANLIIQEACYIQKASQLRELWKLVQQMELKDSIYMQCRHRMHDIIQQYIHMLCTREQQV